LTSRARRITPTPFEKSFNGGATAFGCLRRWLVSCSTQRTPSPTRTRRSRTRLWPGCWSGKYSRWASSLDVGIADAFSKKLLHWGLLPPEEYNDGLILAETSLAAIPVLVSSDHHLLDISEDRLLLVLNDADLLPVHVAHPKGLLKAVR
jgi:hypothetical protein